MEVRARIIHGSPVPAVAGIQAAFRLLAADQERNSWIIRDTEEAWRKGGKVIVLTERSERNAVLVELEALSGKEPRIILATGKLAQYAGRVNRICVGKRDLRFYDYVDIDDPRLRRM